MPDPEFTLDPRLDADTFAVGELALSTVRLMDDARFPWLILVPKRAGMADLVDLSDADAATMNAEIRQTSRVLRELTSPHKLNVAALGNAVRQLHVHVIARFEDDPAWPKPVWGVGTAASYDPATADTLITRLRAGFGLA
jgi:diadenosine tetraphosphate (Ap4A) HIT family hydrolase